MSESHFQTIERAHIEAFLSRSLGDEKARAVWAEALHRLGIPPLESYSPGQVRAVLDTLSSGGGIVGVAARFALVRLNLDDGAEGRLSASSDRLRAVTVPSSNRDGAHAAPASAPSSRTVNIVQFFAPALGRDKAREALLSHAGQLGLAVDELSRDGALRLIEVLGQQTGLLGVVANFAKVKFLLRYPR